MARKRMLDPGIWTNVQVAGLSVLQRLLYIGLISNADDEGRLNGDPTYLKGIIFPHDSITIQNIQDSVKRIVKQGLIVHYRVDGKWYIAHPNWKGYQMINRPTPSKIPPPSVSPHGVVSESSVSPHGVVSEPSVSPHGVVSEPSVSPHAQQNRTEQNGTEKNPIQKKGIEKETTEGVDRYRSLSLLAASGVAVAQCGWFADHYPYSYIKGLVDYCKAKATKNPAGMIMEALTRKWEIPHGP